MVVTDPSPPTWSEYSETYFGVQWFNSPNVASRLPSSSATVAACCSVIYEGRTESHEQLFFLHANWAQQTKESAVVDGITCCVILQCLVTSIACIT